MTITLNKKIINPKCVFAINKENPDFADLKVYAIAEGLTRKNSVFTIESMEKAIPTFFNKPILAYYNKKVNDVEEHNCDQYFDWENFEMKDDFTGEDAERICGVIKESDNVGIEEFEEKKWITFTSSIWIKYNRPLVNLLKTSGKKKVSVEITPTKYHTDENGIMIIDEFVFDGCTIISRQRGGVGYVNAGVPGAHLVLKDFITSERLNKFSIACNEAIENEKFSTKKIGSEPAIKTSLIKKSVSNDEWGNINKTTLRNKILAASNYKTLIRDCYLYVGSDYIDSPSSELKYPVCQIKNNTLVYNINGIESASQMLMANKGEPYFDKVLLKLNKIRQKLDLEPLSKRKREVQKMTFNEKKELFSTDKIVVFSCKDEDGKEKMFVETKPEDKDEKEKVFSLELMSCKEKFEDDDKDDDDIQTKDEEAMEDAEEIDKVSEYVSKMFACIKSDSEKMANDMDAKEKELTKEKEKSAKLEEENKKMAEEKMKKEAEDIACEFANVKDEKKKEIIEMACNKKMSAEEIRKEFVFASYVETGELPETNKSKYSERINDVKNRSNGSVFDKLDKI